MSLLWVSVCFCPVAAEPHDVGAGVVSAKPSQPVTITADELVSDDASETAEFIGNVKVVRGDYTLTADRLKVHYRRSDRPSTPKAVGRANIREIVAEGHVQHCLKRTDGNRGTRGLRCPNPQYRIVRRRFDGHRQRGDGQWIQNHSFP